MTLDERVTALEAALSTILQGGTPNIVTLGNLSLLGARHPDNPRKLFMGPDFDRGLYIFDQERFPDQGTSHWSGLQTFERFDAANPAKGYGFHPLRIWGKLFQIEANGNMVGRNIIAERIYLQHPLHMNPITGNYERPATYDTFGVPRTAGGVEMGGIQTDYANTGTYIGLDGGSVVLVHNGATAVLA